MDCGCINTPFQGDDLIDLIKVNCIRNIPELNITKIIVQLNGDDRLKFENDNPVFPYYISVLRDKSKYLLLRNSVHVKIFYTVTIDGQEYTAERTLYGSLNFPANKEVIKGSTPQPNAGGNND